jgi:hypothetical protein
MPNIIDEFTHECLAIGINRSKAIDVIDVSYRTVKSSTA